MSLIANLFGQFLRNLLALFLGNINARFNGNLNRNLFRDVLASLLGHISTDSVGNFPDGINTVYLGNFAAFGNCNFVRNLNWNFLADRNIDGPTFWGSVSIPGVRSLVAIPCVLGVVAVAIVATLAVSMSLLVVGLANLFGNLIAVVLVGCGVGGLVLLNADLFVCGVALLVRDVLVDLFALLVVDGGADVLALGLVVCLVRGAALLRIDRGAGLPVDVVGDSPTLGSVRRVVSRGVDRRTGWKGHCRCQETEVD